MGRSGAPDIPGVRWLKGKVELMFLGRYEHSIDNKGRLTIPARFREQLAEGAYITQGFDNNLVIMPPSYFEKMYLSINQTRMTDPDARLVKRFIFSNADQVEVDKAGRILIPQFLRSAAGLENASVIVGAGDYLEVWSPELWSRQQELLENTEENNQRFAALDISV